MGVEGAKRREGGAEWRGGGGGGGEGALHGGRKRVSDVGRGEYEGEKGLGCNDSHPLFLFPCDRFSF